MRARSRMRGELQAVRRRRGRRADPGSPRGKSSTLLPRTSSSRDAAGSLASDDELTAPTLLSSLAPSAAPGVVVGPAASRLSSCPRRSSMDADLGDACCADATASTAALYSSSKALTGQRCSSSSSIAACCHGLSKPLRNVRMAPSTRSLARARCSSGRARLTIPRIPSASWLGRG